MGNKAWKDCERRASRFLGGKRTPLSGRNSGHNTTSDVLHEMLYVEAKHRKNQPVYRLYEEAREQAKLEGKRPILWLHEKGKSNALIVLATSDVEFLLELLLIQGLTAGTLKATKGLSKNKTKNRVKSRDAGTSNGSEDKTKDCSPGKKRKPVLSLSRSKTKSR